MRYSSKPIILRCWGYDFIVVYLLYLFLTYLTLREKAENAFKVPYLRILL